MIPLMPPTDNAQKRHVQHSVHPRPDQTGKAFTHGSNLSGKTDPSRVSSQRNSTRRRAAARYSSVLQPATCGWGATGSRRIQIRGCRMPSSWSSPNSPSCKVCDRCTCGYATRALHCPLPAIALRMGTALCLRLPRYNTVHIPDQPRLCRRLCFWADGEQGQHREWAQAHQARPAAPIGRMGRAAQGPARGLYLLE